MTVFCLSRSEKVSRLPPKEKTRSSSPRVRGFFCILPHFLFFIYNVRPPHPTLPTISIEPIHLQSLNL